MTANNRRRKDLFTLSRPDQELLESLGYKEKLAAVDQAIMANAEFLSKIVDNPAIFGHDMDEDEDEEEEDGDDNGGAPLERARMTSPPTGQIYPMHAYVLPGTILMRG